MPCRTKSANFWFRCEYLKMFYLWAIVCLIYCASLSLCARLKPNFIYNKYFHIAAFAPLAVLLVALCRRIEDTGLFYISAAFAVLIVLILIVLFILPYALFLADFYCHGAVTSLMGLNLPKADRDYSRAESAERAQDYDRAIAIYRELAGNDPDDVEAARRLAVLLSRKGDYDTSALLLKGIVHRIPDTSTRVAAALFLSDILCGKLSRPDEAKALLVELKFRIKEEKYTAIVDAKLAQLK